MREQLGILLHPSTHRSEVRGAAVADSEHEPASHEHVDLAELDLFLRVEVGCRAEHDEQCVAIALELRPLVRHDGVFDRELMESKFGRDRDELRLGWAKQAYPGDRVVLLAQEPCRVSDRCRRLDPAAVPIDRGVDHALLDRRHDIFGPCLHRDFRRGRRRALGTEAQRSTGREREARAKFGHEKCLRSSYVSRCYS